MGTVTIRSWITLATGAARVPSTLKHAVRYTADRRRRSLAASLRGLVRDLTTPGRLPGASPLNRHDLWLYVPELRTLAARVGDLKRPVTPFGMQLVHDLLIDGGSPLYDRARAGEMPETVRKILLALDPRETR